MSGLDKEDLKERVIRLGDLVPYQDGAIVSRMVVFTPSGTITCFAFDAGEELSEHTAPYDAVLTMLEGEAEITIMGQHYLLSEGDTIIMPAKKPHAVTAIRRFKMTLVMIHA
jgi:quercetin dioxygenase-like cupin family protein